ncbi:MULTISPECIES: hypothetical protein [Bacillus]|uniref:hypothetical protein n=1 Tax=Bacillus cereus group TaxID=86661 RepID=UPI0008725995|nr:MULTISPECIES: hypothetical protein [Bacillus cereus group]OFC97468.1 hypothetical protein BTGOE5_35080 [Bacillus thuringiensis]MED2846920.1 hypothetical protein [Bacillus toyonensis]OFC97523.1 hypothetical protein BTGOE5_35630 [Bacillus thuringiensis]PFY25760.1 hypothetical protein COL47_00330 [Bacillus toyonensis]PTC12245.1 hypothetical protein C6557_17800 [Bacillus wiedmannii]
MSKNVLRCIHSINDSMHELRTHREFSERRISFLFALSEEEIQVVYEKIKPVNDDFIMEHHQTEVSIQFSFRFK